MSAGPDDLLAGVRRAAGPGADPTRIAGLVRAEHRLAGTHAVLADAGFVAAEIVGAGPLEPLLREPGVTDVLVNGAGRVWVDRGTGVEPAEVVFPDEAAVRRVAQRLISAAGRRLDAAMPYADARLADGTRVHAVIPPLSPQGTCISLRLPPRRAFTLPELVAAGSIPAAGADLLAGVVAARLAHLVTGGTGSGKTTVLSTLLSLVPAEERIVVVEDAAELRPSHPHVVRLEARGANAEGAGAVDLATLVRQALRMRPDRLVVGEVRGAEVLDLLAALNTGHEGGCGTVHANRAEQLPARIEALAAMAGLPRASAHSQLAAAVDVVVHLARGPDGRRRVAGIAMLEPDDDGLVVAVPAALFRADAVVPGPGHAALSRRLGAR
jgi:pilus assembly protein CpaF